MNIPIEKLLKVETFVVHAYSDGMCPDGLASAIILDDILPDREIIFATHQSRTPLPCKPNMLFCDICPPDNRVQEFQAVSAIVLDHHKGYEGAQECITKSFEHHVFADEKEEPGVSGALLAYRHVWRPVYEHIAKGWSREKGSDPDCGMDPIFVERFATLAGVRDTFQKQSPDWQEANEQMRALLFYPPSHWVSSESWGRSDKPTNILRKAKRTEYESRMEVGRIALAKKVEDTKRQAEQVVRFVSDEGVSVAVFPSRYVSDVASMIDAEFAIGFQYVVESGQPKLEISTRSRGDYNCTAFCTFFGGGGHTNAAGCKVDVWPDSPNPFVQIRAMLGQFEARARKIPQTVYEELRTAARENSKPTT